MTVATFNHIDRDTRDRMVANFIETIGNLQALECSDLSEIMDACEIIGSTLRQQLKGMNGHGNLIFAKLIIDQAMRRD